MMRLPRLDDPAAAHGIAARSLLERLRTARVDEAGPPPFAQVTSEPAALWSAGLVTAWAEVMTILLFYQERIRAEGYLDSAVETLSRRLLEAGMGLERSAVALATPPRPGRPVPLVLDPGCGASADFVLRLRAGPGLPATTWLPAGAQFRHHAADAPSVAVFESDAPVSLKPEWNDLPLKGRRTDAAGRLAAGAPGVLLAIGSSLPRAGDHLLLSGRQDASAWAVRQAASVVANTKAGLCEVIFDRPLEADLKEPRVELLGRRTPVFGWNAADFGTLPEAARRRALRGLENRLAGGLHLFENGRCEAHNGGLPEGQARALAVASDGTTYLATDRGLSWLGPDRIWRSARAGSAVRDVACLATAPNGLLMVGTARGQVFTTYDPARGFDRLSGGYVLEAASEGAAPRPVKAALPSGTIRGLMAFGDPASRVVAMTDAGLHAYDPRGCWLALTATPFHADDDLAPLPDLLAGVRLAAALVTADGRAALLAAGSCVSAVRLGPPAPPPQVILGAGADAGDRTRRADLAPGPSDPVTAPPWQWFFPDPVADIAFLSPAGRGGWDAFLVAAGDGVFLCDWSGRVERVRQGLPPGAITRFVAGAPDRPWRVRALHAADVFLFDPASRIWSCECACASGAKGPVLAAADADLLAIVAPLILPDEWPGFPLADPSDLELPLPGPDLPVGASLVLSSARGGTLRGTVETAAAATFDAFGLRERGLRVRLAPIAMHETGATGTPFDRRSAVASIATQDLTVATPPLAPEPVWCPGARLALDGAWADLVDLPAAPASLGLPTSGVAGASRQPAVIDALQIAEPWGVQPLDLAGIAAAAARPDLRPVPRRIALSGRSAAIVPATPGGILAPRAAAAPARALPGFDIRALLAVGGHVLAVAAGRGVYARVNGAWIEAGDGLGAAAATARVLAGSDGGGAAHFHLATDDGIYDAGPDLAWRHLAPPAPALVATLAVLSSGTLLAGGPNGLFAWNGSAWSPMSGGSLEAGAPVAALLAMRDRVLAAPAAGGLLIGAPGRDWTSWGGLPAGVAVSALCRDGPALWFAAADGLYGAARGEAPARRLEVEGATALAAEAGRVAVAGPGIGVRIANPDRSAWTRLALGMNNDVTAAAFDEQGQLLLGVGARLRLRVPSGAWAPFEAPAALGSATPGAAVANALDAGLCSPLRAALSGDAAKALPDDAVVTAVEPGRRWIVGSPGQALGAGAMLLEARQDGVALQPPFGPFAVAEADSAAPWRLSLDGGEGSGLVEAWPGDLVLAAGKADAPSETLVRSVSAGQVSADAATTLLDLDEPLRRLLDPAGVRLTANVVAATQGETVAGEVLGDGNSAATFQTFTLRRSPLTFTPAQDGPRSTLRVFVDGIEWQPAGSLVGAGSSERVYVADIGPDEKTRVRFGDGTTGARLPSGRGNVRATYRAGMRDVGNLSDGVATLLTARPAVASVRGLLRAPARPPRDGGTTAARPPAVLRRSGRLVTAGDYATLAESRPEVAEARVDELRLGGRPLLHLSVAWAGRTAARAAAAAAEEQLRRLIAGAQAVPAPAFALGRCTSLPVRIAARLWIAAGADAAALRSAARSAVTRVLAERRPGIGEPMRRTEIEEALQDLAGVSGVVVDAFHRADRPPEPREVLRASPARVSASGEAVPAQRLVLDATEAGVAIAIEPGAEAA